MPGMGHFGKMGGALVLGLLALAIAFIIFVFLLPYIIPLALGLLFMVLIFIVVWTVVWIVITVGVGVYYFVRHPTEWVKEDKDYIIERVKEAGRRQKGKSRKK